MENGLLPCPNGCTTKAPDYVGAEGVGYQVECKVCFSRGPWGDYGFQAQAGWNALPRATPKEDNPDGN